jgi:hypothetical protein
MTRGTIRQQSGLFGPHRYMTVKTPAHILARLRNSYAHLADITVAALAAYPGIYMSVMWKMDKIGLDCYRYPGNWLIPPYIISQFIQFRRLALDLLVTAPTFIDTG